jgi:16S rRNA (uracil1498-N3)-methyltransferase
VSEPGGLPPSDADAHVLVEDVRAPRLDDETRHHLHRVRRLGPGARCTLTDGRGSWVWCRLGTGDEPALDGEIVTAPRPEPTITIAIALTKGEKPDVVIQKLTELGVDRIVPFRAERSIVRWDEAKAATHHRRWRTIAAAAVAQSRGCWLPRVDTVADLAAVTSLGAARLDRGGDPPSLSRCVVAVGPEGGWAPSERAALPDVVTLGGNVLRAETAAMTAGGMLTALRSGIVRESAK